MNKVMEMCRQTGRTTRLLQQAQAFASLGGGKYKAFVVCATQHHKNILSRNEFAYGITLITADEAIAVNLMSDTCLPNKSDPDVNVLIDHDVIESRYSKLLDVLFQTTDYIRVIDTNPVF